MVLERAGQALVERELPDPEPAAGEVLVRVLACGVCRTDLHVVDGELPRRRLNGGAPRLRPSDSASQPKLPLILGHQVVGEVVGGGQRWSKGDRVGIPWLAWADGDCRYCRSERENLCERALFTGYTRDGGYAELAVADERFCMALHPDAGPETAPLLCAGMIGYRALRMCGDAERLGLYGFGASAHLICQVAAHQGRRVFAVTRDSGDEGKAAFARSLGAEWAGTAAEVPEPLDAAIIFAPAGELVVTALRALARGGVVVCAGIHMSDIPSFPYEHLWHERQIRSVANLTRRDGEEFLPVAREAGVKPEITTYPLGEASHALSELRAGRVRGAAVLVPEGEMHG
jgi:propanol-preferring alcohol dehydrogenase